MRHLNKHTATITPPGGKDVPPGGVCHLDAKTRENGAVKAWLAAGWLEALEPEPTPEANPEKPESKKPGRR